jgi:hypothetical protein
MATATTAVIVASKVKRGIDLEVLDSTLLMLPPNVPKLSHGHWRPSSECNDNFQIS